MGGGRDSPTSPSLTLGCCRCCGPGSPCLHGAGAHCHLLAQSSMAGSCEISNIFSNYISAMYQPDEVQPTLDMLGHLGDDSSLGLSLPASQPPAQSTGRTGEGQWGSCEAVPLAGKSTARSLSHWDRSAASTMPQFPQGKGKRLWEETLGGPRYGCWEHV